MSTNEDGRAPDDVQIPDDAFILPDEPLVRDGFREALISPDEPIERVEEEGVVVGMDGSTDHRPVRFSGIYLEPDQMAAVLERVATSLREQGFAGLKASARTPHFETALKAYIAGYYSTEY